MSVSSLCRSFSSENSLPARENARSTPADAAAAAAHSLHLKRNLDGILVSSTIRLLPDSCALLSGYFRIAESSYPVRSE